MIRPSEISSAKDAARYYSDVAKAAEYYQGEGIPNQWAGKGAAHLGLSGGVEHGPLEAVLNGQVNGQVLGRQAKDGSIEHRKGWDFTISAPKSVSMAALAFGRDDVRDAHRQAVRAAMQYLEERVEARIKGDDVRTGNLVMAQYEHVTSRQGDPQLHAHVLVANVTMYEGRAYSLHSRSLFDRYATADAIYHQELSRGLQQAGYQVEHDKQGRVELADYSREQMREFSKRSKEIEEALADRGTDRGRSSAEQRETVALSTRAKTKNYIETREANVERWRGQAAAVGIAPPALVDRLVADATWTSETAAAGEAVKRAVAHLSERDMVFSEKQLHKAIAAFNRGQARWGAIDQAIRDMTEWGELVRDRDGSKYTARASIAAEAEIEARVSAGHGQHRAVMTGAEFDQALAAFQARKTAEFKKDFVLSHEQRAAACAILTGDDRFQGVQGLAGTGKTTMLEFVREAADAKGWEIRGMSNGAEQAAKLEAESGIRSTTTARHLANEKKAGTTDTTAPTAKAARDAQLAQAALATWEREQDRFLPRKLDWQALSKQGELIRDSRGNAYVRHQDGSLYAENVVDPKPARESGDYYQGSDGRTYQFTTVNGNVLDPDGVRELGHDGYLAQAALATWEREQGRLVKSHVDFERMACKTGVFFDGQGQRYVRDREGWIYSEAMFKNERRVGSYVQGKGGVVFTEKRQTRLFGEGKLNYKKAGMLRTAYAKHLMRGADRERQAGERERLQALLEKSRDQVRTRGPRHLPEHRLHAVKNTPVTGLREAWAKHQIHQGREAARSEEVKRLAEQASSEAVRGNKALWIHDEASMSGTKEFNAMTKAAEKAGARMVSLGDVNQHQSVEAGKTFERLQDNNHLPTKSLGRDSIVRQADGSMAKQAVSATLDSMGNKPDAEKLKQAFDAIEKVEVRDAQDRLAMAKPDANRDAKREAARVDNRAVIQRMARDYAELSPEDRKHTIIITGTNADRKALNREIREVLRERGQLGEQDRQVTTLKKLAMTAEEKGQAVQYKQTDPTREPIVVQVMDAGKDNQVKPGDRFEVIGANEHANTLKLRDLSNPERIVTVDPKRVSLEAYERETRGLANGDSIRFTENHRLTTIDGDKLPVINGQFAQVERVEADRTTLLIQDLKGNGEPQRVAVANDQALKIDHAATYTSFKSQGHGKDTAWLHHNTEVGRHGWREWYVNITRAKANARVYTQNLDKALEQTGIRHDKTSAIEFAKANGHNKVEDRAVRETLSQVKPQPNPFDQGFAPMEKDQFAERANTATKGGRSPVVTRDDYDLGR
ncbi:hypothetical protein CH75_16760 [Dyella jiangningensis]|nr:hypothetical protein CH75_16760 [Dyella jiangningensis]